MSRVAGHGGARAAGSLSEAKCQWLAGDGCDHEGHEGGRGRSQAEALGLCDEQAILWLRNRVSVGPGRLDPEGDGGLGVLDGVTAIRAVGHASGKLRHIDHESRVFIAPPKDHFVSGVFHGLEQFVLGEDLADLFHLIGFRLRAFALQIDPLHDSTLGENVVTA